MRGVGEYLVTPSRLCPRSGGVRLKCRHTKVKRNSRARDAAADCCSCRHRCGPGAGTDVRFNGGGTGGRCGGSVTPEEAAAQRVAEVVAERDAVQANLLELDGSFAKQVLEGATLTGRTRDRWAAASAALATLWETFLAYSAVGRPGRRTRHGAEAPRAQRPARAHRAAHRGLRPAAGRPGAARPQGPGGGRPPAGDARRRRRRDAPGVHRGDRGDLGRRGRLGRRRRAA